MQNYCRLARALNMHKIKIFHIIGVPGSGSFNVAKTLIYSDTTTGGIMNLFTNKSDKHYSDINDLKDFDKRLGKLWNTIFENDNTSKLSTNTSKRKVYVLRDWSSSFTSQEFTLLSSLNNWSFLFVDRKDPQKTICSELYNSTIDSNEFKESHILNWDNFHYFKHICISLHIKFMLIKFDEIDWKNIFFNLKVNPLPYYVERGLSSSERFLIERSPKFKKAIELGNLGPGSQHLDSNAELKGY